MQAEGPPSGTHRYEFTLYAMSQPLAAAGPPTVDAVCAGGVLGDATLTGRYGRR